MKKRCGRGVGRRERNGVRYVSTRRRHGRTTGLAPTLCDKRKVSTDEISEWHLGSEDVPLLSLYDTQDDTSLTRRPIYKINNTSDGRPEPLAQRAPPL